MKIKLIEFLLKQLGYRKYRASNFHGDHAVVFTPYRVWAGPYVIKPLD